MDQSPRLLFLLNPGRQSRAYLLGLLAAAKRLEIPCAVLELKEVWDEFERSRTPQTIAAVQQSIGRLVRKEKLTHTIGYGYAGVTDLGVAPSLKAGEPMRTLWSCLGMHQILLWTDHPNWMLNGSALEPASRGVLGRANHTHLVKSESAAAELAAVTGWSNVFSLPMGEEVHQILPAKGIRPIHDVVAIMGGVASLPATTRPFLAADDPDDREISLLFRKTTLACFMQALGSFAQTHGHNPACQRLGEDWIAAKLERPLDSFWRLSHTLAPEHAPALALLRGDAKLWYAAIGALQQLVTWRRFFKLAWLARRVNVGVYGCSAAPLEIPQPAGADAWVDYPRQSAVYALGRLAINSNAAHDEEGVTHKPFQIAAGGVPCLHHRTHGLEDLFEPGSEILPFTSCRELLEQTRAMLGDEPRRLAMAGAIRARAVRSHSWEDRLERMLRLASGASSPGAQVKA